MLEGVLTHNAAAEAHGLYRDFAARVVAPQAVEADRVGRLSLELVEALRAERFLGGPMAREYGGAGLNMVSYGLLTGEVGRACSSARTLLTVHNLVGMTLQKWGNPFIKSAVLPDVARGCGIAAIALSEPEAGSDIHAIGTTLRRDGAIFRLNGQKTWTSFGMLADWFLVFAQAEGGAVAAVVGADSPGLTRRPITSITGIRGSMMAQLSFEDCPIEPQQLVGRPGFGLSHIAAYALDQGRYSVAWGAVGIAEACLAETAKYLSERRQFGGRMIDLPLARAKLTRIIAESRAARQLCLNAGRLRDAKSPDALVETMIAKYVSTAAAGRIANIAVSLHGARGLSNEYPVERLLRDAKAMEIIEGGEEIHELLISAQLIPEMLHA